MKTGSLSSYFTLFIVWTQNLISHPRINQGKRDHSKYLQQRDLVTFCYGCKVEHGDIGGTYESPELEEPRGQALPVGSKFKGHPRNWELGLHGRGWRPREDCQRHHLGVRKW